MFVRDAGAAMSWAANQVRGRSRDWHNDCLMFVRSCFNVGAHFPSAEKGWYGTRHRHTSWPPPAGVPIWWTNGRYGHVALSAGNGLCYSTDFLRHGSIDKVKIASVTAGWGQQYRGWSEDINGVRVHTKGEVYTTKPDMSARKVAEATKAGTKAYWGIVLKKAVAAEVGKGDMNLKSAALGHGFRTQYSLLQKKFLRSVGAAASSKQTDGVPGKRSLTWLGHRHGFDVSD